MHERVGIDLLLPSVTKRLPFSSDFGAGHLHNWTMIVQNVRNGVHSPRRFFGKLLRKSIGFRPPNS